MSQSFPNFSLNPNEDSLFCFPSLLAPSPEVIQAIQCEFSCSRGSATFQMMTVTLGQKHLLILDKNKKVEKLDLSFQLKFEIIYCDKNNIRSPIKSFRLKNPVINFQMTLTSQNNDSLVKFLDQLTKKINRIGFKEYFKPIQRLGKGGYGTVYEVQSLIDKKRYATKAIPKNYFKEDTKAMKSLINEIKIMRKIDHPNTIKLFGVYESENTIYILLQLLKGGNLLQRMLKRGSNLSKDERKIKQIIQGTLKGLKYLNSLGIVHRDIKPQNIMLRNMSQFHPVIIDFGFSVIMPCFKNNYISDFQIVYPSCGTPGFLAPQLFSATPTLHVSHKSDIFALGATLYMLCANSSLFIGKDHAEILMKNKNMEHTIDKKINEEIRDLIERMITRNPIERIDSEQALMHSYLQEKSNYQSYLENARNNGLKMLIEATSGKYDEGKKEYKTQS